MDMFDEVSPQPAATAAGGDAPASDDVLGFMGGGSSPAPQPAGAEDPFAAMPPPSDPFGASGSAQSPQNSALREWEAKLDEDMSNKAQEELQQKKVKREAAQKEIQQFYADRKTNMAKKFDANRKADADWKAMIAGKDSNKNPWEKVVSMIDQNAGAPAKEGETINALTDTSRMKNMLIQLKSEPIPN